MCVLTNRNFVFWWKYGETEGQSFFTCYTYPSPHRKFSGLDSACESWFELFVSLYSQRLIASFLSCGSRIAKGYLGGLLKLQAKFCRCPRGSLLGREFTAFNRFPGALMPHKVTVIWGGAFLINALGHTSHIRLRQKPFLLFCFLLQSYGLE